MTLIPPKPPKVNAALGIAMPQLWQYEVTGIFNTGMFQYDNQFVVMSLPAAQQFTGLGSAVSGIQIRVRNPGTAPAVGVRLVEKLGYPVSATSTGRARTRACSARCKLEKLAMGLVIFFIMIVAAFNIVGTLTMVVADKTREIGILQAMGLTGRCDRPDLPVAGRDDRRGGHLHRARDRARSWRTSWTGPAGCGSIRRCTSSTGSRCTSQLPDVLVVLAASFLLALVATWFPARGAARLTPVEAIRHE